jgi:hypothetical protein
VESVQPTGREEDVFNLTVEGVPEYFANGILVHNCLVYMARNVRWQRDPRPKTAPPEQWGRKQQQQMSGWNNAFGGASDEPRILGSRA